MRGNLEGHSHVFIVKALYGPVRGAGSLINSRDKRDVFPHLNDGLLVVKGQDLGRRDDIEIAVGPHRLDKGPEGGKREAAEGHCPAHDAGCETRRE